MNVLQEPHIEIRKWAVAYTVDFPSDWRFETGDLHIVTLNGTPFFQMVLSKKKSLLSLVQLFNHRSMSK